MRMSLLSILMCPDCSTKLVKLGTGTLICSNCKRVFPINNGVIVLLPSDLDQHKQAEELAWQQLNHEGKDKPAWMALIHKRDEVFYFMDKIAPNLCLKGKVLEIGAGSCWASSLMKQRFPDCYFVASDVSPTALWKGRQVCKILGAIPDALIAGDIEQLPFANESFDTVFGNAVIHHLSDPFKGLEAIQRVLKGGGLYYGSGELAAGRLLGAIWQSGIGLASKREKELNVNEKIYSVGQWKEMFIQSGFKDVHISFEKDWQYRLYHWFPPVYYKLIGGLPGIFLKYVPCGIKITAAKG